VRLTIEPTTQVVTVNGVQTRVWEGQTQNGTPVTLFIARVAVPEGAPAEVHAQFARELAEQRPPTVSWPARLIL
jgi:hypothetical protein